MRLEYYGVSDTGSVRNINQDAFCMYRKADAGLFEAADGMGGYADGEKASRIVIDELSKWWDSFVPDICAGDFKNMVYDAEQAVAAANRRIYTQLNQNGVCGTTVAALLIYQSYCGIIYAGDSRCYQAGFQAGSARRSSADFTGPVALAVDSLPQAEVKYFRVRKYSGKALQTCFTAREVEV